MKNRFQQHEANLQGKDFVIGDIHGRYDQLMVGLAKASFDFDNDRLFSVGDLIDRGAKNMECLELIDESWFYPVLGNHEEMMLNALQEKVLGGYSGGRFMRHWTGNGGNWVFDITDDERALLDDYYCPLIGEVLPVALEFTAENGMRIGITHAGLPRAWTWDQLRKGLEAITSLGNRSVQECMWTRTKIQDNGFMFDVLGVDLIINGHTPSIKEVWRGNNVFIDLGACNGDKLNPINVMDLLDRQEKNEHYAWKE